ncbi:MAG TPA: class I SAM-dependent methyltransferase family protein [Candidatus Bathyarchaeia archaeon]|nr:class I SAM-dependent methyltransferase family protein [Candidatus Bathyarchaeia archaeon]
MTGKTEKPSLQVPKKKAETAIRFLSKKAILSRDFDFITLGDAISLPLTRTLSSKELSELLELVPDATEAQQGFEPRNSYLQTLRAAMNGLIPQALMADLPKSYDIVGDIGILELKADLVPYEQKIAQAILAIHSNIHAVYAKAGQVEGDERIRPLRHLAGESRTTTVHREFGCSFKVDLSKVFFSPRLSTEHQRVANLVNEGERVVDMFAGVGPFSILIAKKTEKVTVDAIDSNPVAAKLIGENARINKVASKIKVRNGDAGTVIHEELLHLATRVIMNHPSASKHFVGAACDALGPSGGMIHYYTFAEGQDPEVGARRELEHSLKPIGYMIRQVQTLHRVREVAPMKWQVVIDAEIIPGA